MMTHGAVIPGHCMIIVGDLPAWLMINLQKIIEVFVGIVNIGRKIINEVKKITNSQRTV